MDKPEWVIASFLSKGIWSDNGDHESAYEMFSAYHNLIEMPFEKDWQRLASYDGTKILVPRMTIEQRRALLLTAILNGEIESRGFIEMTRLQFLFYVIQAQLNPKLTTAAIKALIHYTFPSYFFFLFQIIL